MYQLKEDGLLHFADCVDVDAATPIRFRSGEAITGRVFQERIIRNIPRDQAAEYMKYVGWKFISF